MAIVEDEVRNESEEENEIEVVVEDDDGEQDSADDDSEDEDEDEALETKVAELEHRLAEDPYNYDDHIELIQALWGLSELDRWQAAFEQLHQISLLRAEHWLLRLQTEVSLAHSPQAQERVAELFQQAALDCYSIPILSEWCSWSLGAGDADAARAQLDEVARRAGADPLSGKLFWDARAELEKAQLENLSEDDPGYKKQVERVLFCLEEIVSRPLLHGEEAWPQLEELALKIQDQQLLDTAKTQHEAAVDFLQKITPYEDRLLTMEDPEEKCKVYQEYIDAVKDLAHDKKFIDCDCDGILKVLYDRATSECLQSPASFPLLRAFAAHAAARSSRATCWRVLCACARRCPRRDVFWVAQMRHREKEGASFDEIKTILETALAKGMDNYKDTENLWLAYLEYMRRHTAFDNEEEVEKLRRTFRLAWDSLAETWGAEANDCEVPLFWARMEYKRMGDPKQGKEIFEEIFKYGENKTMSKYWEAFIHLEATRSPPPSENKLRELHKRALKFVTDYPPAIARLYTDLERDVGSLETMETCVDQCEVKLKEWRDSYQAMKDKMTGNKQKGKLAQNKKGNKFDRAQSTKRDESKPTQSKSKRKAEETKQGGSEVKKKRDSGMEVEVGEKEANTSANALKRAHTETDSQATDSKRARRESSTEPQSEESREACTLFVSNLEFKVNEENLRKKLAEFGDIVALRLKAGVKAFGGSICYCQYKTPESVDKAVQHDRTPLDGRPMFLSRYSAKKDGKGRTFKYPTEGLERNKLFVRNLPYEHCTKAALEKVFDGYGKLRDIRVVTFKDGKPKGLAYVEYEDDASAATALEKTNGLLLGDRNLVVALSAPPKKSDAKQEATSLGQAKREPGGATRRTQLSSFIPSVLLKPSTSKANGSHSSEEKRPLSNSDFRTLLLKK